MQRRMFRMSVNNLWPSTRWVWFLAFLLGGIWSGLLPRTTDRKSTRLNSSHQIIYNPSLHDALPISSHSSHRLENEVGVHPCLARRGAAPKCNSDECKEGCFECR